MKIIFNYIICGLLLFVGLFMLLSGGVWSFSGLTWFVMLFLSGEIWPAFWRKFWLTNLRLMSLLGCL